MTADSAHPVRIGVPVRPQHAEYTTIRQACAAAADAGADIVFNWDYFSRVLGSCCAQLGRDPAAVERSVLAGGPPDKSGEPLLATGGGCSYSA